MYIDIKKKEFELTSINRLINEGNLDLKTHLKEGLINNWSNIQKSRLIESIILRFPIPIIYLTEKINGEINVIDGFERLKAINEFMNNEFPLEGLELLKECEGKYYEDKDNKEGLERKYFVRLFGSVDVCILFAPTLDVMTALYKRVKQE